MTVALASLLLPVAGYSVKLVKLLQSSCYSQGANQLYYRLEAATSRLEDMAMSLDDPDAPKPVDAAAGAAVQPSAPAQPKAVAAAPAPSAPAASSPPQIDDFDALVKNEVQNFVNLGEKIGGLVGEQVSDNSVHRLDLEG